MNRKQKLELLFVGILLFLAALYMDFTKDTWDIEKGIPRGPVGGDAVIYPLELDAGEALKNYDYQVKVEPQKVTEEMAEEYFKEAKEEIDEGFCIDGEETSSVRKGVHMEESYVKGLVLAEWLLSDYTYVDHEGLILGEIPAEGVLVTARVTLSCGEYMQIYEFPFQLMPRELDVREGILSGIASFLEKQQLAEGEAVVMLPAQMNGVELSWKKRKEHLAIKVLLLELFIGLALPIIEKERQKEAEKKRKEELLYAYPQMVSQITILVGAGMPIKQAWNRISAQYLDKRQKGKAPKTLIYEEMCITNREIQDGESERRAYQRFGERAGLQVYYRLVRILVQNLEKGNHMLKDMLQGESRRAMEERRTMARKMGEEATTKLLFPLLLMMAVVMLIVIAPAMVNLSI